MGGEREDVVPAKTGKVSGSEVVLVGTNIRFHENRGEVHFHDDTNNRKSAVPSAVFWQAWEEIRTGVEESWSFLDRKNKTELTLEVIEDAETSDLDIEITIVEKEVESREGNFGATFKALERFVKGIEE